MRKPIRSRSSIAAALVAACLVALLAAAPADAARVKQIRVGDHTDYTRIVLELDGPASYSLDQRQSGSGSELEVELQAGSDGRVLTSRSRLVESITMKPGTDHAVAVVKLRSPGVNVKELVLKSPHRIVLDLSPGPRAPAPKPSPTVATPVPSGLPSPTATPGPRDLPSPTATPGPRDLPSPTATPSPRDLPSPTATPGPRDLPSPTATPGPRDLPGPTATPRRLAPEPEPAPTPGAAPPPEPESDVAAASEATAVPERRVVARVDAPDAGPPDAASRPESSEERGAAEGREAGPAAGATPGESRRKPAATSPPARRERPGETPAAAPGLLEKLGVSDPALGLTFAAGGVAFLLVAFLFLRRRSARIAREAAEAPWPPPGAEERPEFATATTEEDAEEEAEAPPPRFGDAADEPRSEADATGAVRGFPEAPLDAEPEVVAKEVASVQVEELERRIERLEARLADTLDARERLERQLAAHTEELRVQRAAIARTQRAVRAAVRGPEAEAAPSPSPMAGPKPMPPRAPGQGEGQ